MKTILNRLTHYEHLTKAEANQLLIDMSEGKFNPTSIAVLLTVFMMRSISIEELEGFRNALQDRCKRINLEPEETIDLCGTGGDNKSTFNISTLASLVVAANGIPVAKHGNYGVSSVSGSSNVLEYLGAKFTDNNDQLNKSLHATHFCFLHAPLFHPAMKNIAPVRQQLGLKTFFNILGPMINPAFPKHQMVGVYDLELLRLYGYLYQKGQQNYTIIHSLSGHDEISLTTTCKFISNNKEGLLSAEDLGISPVNEAAILGGNSVKQAASIFLQIIDGKGTSSQNNVVCANAGWAISMVKKCSWKEGFEQARETLKSGKAFQTFKKFVEINQ